MTTSERRGKESLAGEPVVMAASKRGVDTISQVSFILLSIRKDEGPTEERPVAVCRSCQGA
jgi:hypothetical protein